MRGTQAREHLIEAGRLEGGYWREFWDRRELLLFLSLQMVRLRYRQTLAGAAWAGLRPLLLALAMTGIFGWLVRFPSGGVPYVIVTLSGLAPWLLVSGTLGSACFSVSNYGYLISKVYFPRLALPVSTLLLNFLDFLVIMAVLVLLMGWYHQLPTTRILWLPVALVLSLLAGLAGGIWIAALNVRHRDVGVALPFLIQCWMLISPVGFTSDNVPRVSRLGYSVNPMVGLIDLFRYCLFPAETQLYLPAVAISAFTIGVMLVSATWYFRRVERLFTDVA